MRRLPIILLAAAAAVPSGCGAIFGGGPPLEGVWQLSAASGDGVERYEGLVFTGAPEDASPDVLSSLPFPGGLLTLESRVALVPIASVDELDTFDPQDEPAAVGAVFGGFLLRLLSGSDKLLMANGGVFARLGLQSAGDDRFEIGESQPPLLLRLITSSERPFESTLTPPFRPLEVPVTGSLERTGATAPPFEAVLQAVRP